MDKSDNFASEVDQISDSRSDLNKEQMQAVLHLDGALLVLAGAGTGKTKMLTARIAELIHQGKAKPSEILCVTFTNKAANEMRSRVNSLIGNDLGDNIWLGTFHSIAARILRENPLIDSQLSKDFTILDSDDQSRLIKKIIDEDEAVTDTKQKIIIITKGFSPKSINFAIQKWKDRGETWEDVQLELSKKKFKDKVRDKKNWEIAKIYEFYQKRLKSLNAVDFGDLLLYNLQLFKNHSDVLKKCQDRFRYILVDEYQDTNTAQYLWLKLLANPRNNICCVGDDDQSIYGWRGAVIGNMYNFKNDFPKLKIVRLERNYRSTSYILNAASGLIVNNSKRLKKKIWTEGNQGEKIEIALLAEQSNEANYVISKINKIVKTGSPYADIAILVRSNFMTREFEEKLLKFRIPYKLVGSTKFYEREEIRDAIAYLQLIVNPSNDLAFERIVNKPTRGIGKKLLEIITTFSKAHCLSYFEASNQLCTSGNLKRKQENMLFLFVDMIHKWQHLLDKDIPCHELADIALNESRYFDMWESKNDIDPQSEGRVENLHEIISAMEDFDNLYLFLEHAALTSEQGKKKNSNAVSLMTLHASKGLEFSYVFLPCWDEGLFPNQRSIDERELEGLEEERRLAYVGITRAKKKVYISCVANRSVHGEFKKMQPSSFIKELPSENVSFLNIE